jgi:intergrase/recombinase
MTKPLYEVIIDEETNRTTIKRTDLDGKEWFIPTDESNSDYQAYLNKDKPQVEHLTEIPTK